MEVAIETCLNLNTVSLNDVKLDAPCHPSRAAHVLLMSVTPYIDTQYYHIVLY